MFDGQRGQSICLNEKIAKAQGANPSECMQCSEQESTDTLPRSIAQIKIALLRAISQTKVYLPARRGLTCQFLQVLLATFREAAEITPAVQVA